MRFALVVPALNEEKAIAGTLNRTLAARAKVLAETPVTDMKVVFVNDGSTDRTQEIVDQPEFDEVVKVRFPYNRGYGAAIKAGWQATDAELLGFIDGDGTCDPNYCVPLINRLEETRADVVLAGRLNPNSQMPLIRKVGNYIFARLLGLVSGKSLTDCASGFRVVRRSSLKYMSPLPDGLHFTPAMSAICLLDPRLRIEEVPMPYKERIGRSKLRVLKDGLRFLYTILFTACCYSPIKTVLGASLLTTAVGALLLWILLWAGVSSSVALMLGLGGAGVILPALWTGVICHQLNFMLLGPRRRVGWAERTLQSMLDYKRLMGGGLLLASAGLSGLIAIGLGWPAADLWVLALPVLLMGFGASCALGGMIVRVVWAVHEKQKALLEDEYKFNQTVILTAKAKVEVEPARVHVEHLTENSLKSVGVG
jgi:glycosyltransferase involved in cell wall biosynthesis